MAGHMFGVTTHGYDKPIGELVCPRMRAEYQQRNDQPNKYTACELGRTQAVFPNRQLRLFDVTYGGNDGYSYGSFQRCRLQKRRFIPPADTVKDMYRLPPTTNSDYNWFLGDPALAPGYDQELTRNKFGQCELEQRTYPCATEAGLTTDDVNRVYHLQVRGRVERNTETERDVLPVGACVEDTARLSLALKDRHPEKTVWRTVAGPDHELATDLDGCPQRDACPQYERTPMERQPCETALQPHVWYKHRQRHPLFHSHMTRFVEVVRINDKMYEHF